MNLNQNRTNGEKSSLLPLHLFNKDHGVVSTVFQHSFNIKFPELLFHVGSISESLSATGITIDDQLVDRLLKAVDVGNRVLYKNNQLFIYTDTDIKTISLSNLTEVDLRIPKVLFDKHSLAQIVGAFRVINFAENWGLGDQYAPQKVVGMIHQSHNAEERTKTLAFLFGRGRGLTPSGDDITVGFLSILTSADYSQLSEWQKTVHERLERGGTTDVSDSYLRAALEGYTSKKMIAFLKVVQNGEIEQLQPAILAIQEFGHTSGTDTLLGMYTALTLLQQDLREK
ncbi:DUF2877 domain-containing protein [Lentilactobacillus raoultii]|uniref:DUF2877 domain-containing protein n=1 Tax=Lentilactobacillus raoultii TaxID=1987503 RepID=A0ABW3PLB2_9LACO|nr:DUF2877 domain-containing protein [Lentilactobacillus raoultii]